MSSAQCADCGSNFATYLRVAAVAIAAYDWLWTLPVEFEIYSDQISLLHLDRACILFILIRYTSIAAVVANAVGYFKSNWTVEACRDYMYLAPVLKSIQMAIASTILFIRTWAISRRSKHIFWLLLISLFVCFTLEMWSSVWKRVPVQNLDLNCASANEEDSRISWVFYLTATVFDLECLVIASYYLIRQSSSKGLQGLSRKLLKEGILYYVVMQAINIANLVIFLKADMDTESAAAMLGYTLTWIMAQRILIQLHRLRRSTTRSRSRSTSGGLGEPARGMKAQASSPAVHRMTSNAHTIPFDDVELGGVHISTQVERHYTSGWGTVSLPTAQDELEQHDLGRGDEQKRERKLDPRQNAHVVFPGP